MIRWAPILLCLLAPVLPAAGQSPADRSALARFQDSLATAQDTAALRALARTPVNRHGGDHADDLAQLRAGLIAMRLAQLGADPDASDALAALRRVIGRRPEWPVAWHALAEAEVLRAAWERADPLALGNRVGTGTLERATEHEARALAADPAYQPAAVTLADLTLALRDTARFEAARDALRRAVDASSPPGAALLLALGRLERAAGAPDLAASAFSRIPPGDTLAPLGRLELARTRLAVGAADGPAEYYASAALDDPAAVAGYREDLVPIAADSDLAGFDAARGDARAAWLHRFWTDRDRAELRGENERLVEHYRRLLYARRHFALTVSRRFYGPADAYRSGSVELDDRGVIYVRHGEPATRLRPFVFGLMPNETWRYNRADGDLLFHFSAGYDQAGGGDLYDYRLVESVTDLRGAADAPPDQLLLSRQSLSSLYGKMLNWGPYGAARAAAHERAIGEVSIAYGTSTDSYERQYPRRLTAYANLVAVGSRDGSPLAHFVFAIGPAGTAPDSAAGGATYPVRVRLVALDGNDRAFASVDSTLVFRLSRPLERGQYLIGRVELPVPPGLWSWRAALEEGQAGVVLPRDTVRVDRRGLALSDLALGIRAASARWVPAPADTVLLTPFDLFLEGSEVELYYETSGAEPGTAYRHRIAVYRAKGDRLERRPVVALGFDERADAPLVRSRRTLQLGRLKPGTYVVEVKVAGPAGESAERRRQLRVVRAER